MTDLHRIREETSIENDNEQRVAETIMETKISIENENQQHAKLHAELGQNEQDSIGAHLALSPE